MRRPLAAFLAWMACLGAARADVIPHLRASWRGEDVGSVVFAPDGRSLVTSGVEGARLRDAATGRVRAALGGREGKPTFTPDGRLVLAPVRSDRSRPLEIYDLHAWDVATGRPLEPIPYIADHVHIESFTLSADGRRLAFVDNSGRLPVVLKSTEIHSPPSVWVSWHNANPNPTRVKVWDVAAWEEVAVVDGGLPLALAPDGRTLATGGPDWDHPEVRLWDASSGRRLATPEGQAAGPRPFEFSPDGRLLAVGSNSNGGRSELWEITDGRRWPLDAGASVWSEATFSPDGRWLFPAGLQRPDATIGRRIIVPCIDVAAMPPRPVDLGPGEATASPDGRRYATLPEARPPGGPVALTFFDLPSRRESGRITLDGPQEVRFSPDGQWLAARVARRVASGPHNSGRDVEEIALVDPASARRVATITPTQPARGRIGWEFAPDGRALAVWYRTEGAPTNPGEPDPNGRPKTVEVWDLLLPP